MTLEVPRNHILRLGHGPADGGMLPYPDSHWRRRFEAGSPEANVRLRTPAGERRAYPVDSRLESFLFGPVPASKIDIQKVDRGGDYALVR